jgi:ribosomal protein S14
MASKYLNIKDYSKRKKYKQNELNYLSKKTFNLISGRINYAAQPLLFNNLLLKLLESNNKLFIKKSSNKIVLNIPKIIFSFDFILKLKKYLNNNIIRIKKLDSSNNNLVYYTNIQKESGKISYIRTKNRCILTGRSHGIHRLFKLSRIKLRELASHGMILGITKSSW